MYPIIRVCGCKHLSIYPFLQTWCKNSLKRWRCVSKQLNILEIQAATNSIYYVRGKEDDHYNDNGYHLLF